MNCENYQKCVSELVDGELSQEAYRELFEHLAGCRACQEFLLAVQRFRHILLTAPQPEGGERREGRGLLRGHGAPIPGRQGRLAQLRTLRINLPVPVAVVVLAGLFLLSLLIAPLMSRRSDIPVRQRVVYVMTLPTIEINSHRASPPTTQGEQHR